MAKYNAGDSRVKFRFALHSDYDKVMDINRNVYGGKDYLWQKYYEFLGDPNCRLFVTEVDGKVVGFVGAQVINNGRAYLEFGGRVHSDYQGKGLMGINSHGARLVMAELFPSVTHLAFTAVYKPIHDQLLQTGIIRTYRWGCLPYTIENPKASLGILKNMNISSHIKRLTPSQAMDILNVDKIQKILFGESSCFLFTNYWCPLEINQQNLKIAVKSSNVIMSFHPSKNSESISLSFDSSQRVPDGVRTDVWFYGKDMNDLYTHSMMAIKQCIELSQLGHVIHVIIHYPCQFDRKTIEHKLSSVCGYPVSDDTFVHPHANSFLSKL